MLKGKIKLPAPDKVRRVFPDRLGSLVLGFDEKGNEVKVLEFEFESGEELEPIQPGELGFQRESNDGDEAMDDDVKDQIIRQKPNPVSVLKSISDEEKRSDLEYEVGPDWRRKMEMVLIFFNLCALLFLPFFIQLSQREINLEKLQRIAGAGIPDGGGLRATAWKVMLEKKIEI